jgi:hypothetical protein
MTISMEFMCTSGRRVCDETRLDLIRKELRVMADRQEKMDIMDYSPHLLNCLYEAIEIIDEYCDYDPTPDSVGEPPITASEMHSAAWKQHQELHS